MSVEIENTTLDRTVTPSQVALQNSSIVQAQHLPLRYVTQLNPQQVTQPQQQRVIISVEEMFGYLRRFWLVASIVGLLAAVGIFAYLQSREPVYESTATVLLNHNSSKELNLQTVKSGEKSEYNLPAMVKNLHHEIGSDKFRLSLYENISPKLRAEVIGDDHGENEDVPEDRLFIERLASQINISILKDSHMVSVTAKHSDNETAAALANAYVEHFAIYSREQEMEQTRKVSDFLSSKASELLAQVKQKEAELLEFRKKKGIVSSQAGTELASSKITTLNNQLVTARLQQEKLQDMLYMINNAGDNPEEMLKVPALAENTVLSTAYTSLAQSRVQVATLSTDFGRKHPSMIIAVRQEQAALQNLSKLVTQYVGSLTRQMTTTKAKVASLEKKVDSAMGDMVATANKSVSQELKEQELTSARALYSSLVSQMNEANIALQFKGADNVRVTEHALASRERIFPRTSLSAVLGGAAFAGCFLGIPLTFGFGQRIMSHKEETHTKSSQTVTQDPSMCLDYIDPQARPQPIAYKYPTLATLPPLSELSPIEWVKNVTSYETETGTDLGDFVRGMITTGGSFRGIIVTGDRKSNAKSLSAAALTMAAHKQGLRTMLVSCEEMFPAFNGYLSNQQKIETGEPKYKSIDEVLSPFITPYEGMYFIDDDVWEKTPSLCAAALCNAQHCVDILILDAPLIDNEQDIKLLTDFASTSVLVRHDSDEINFQGIQKKFHRILPNCPVAGEILIK